MSQETDTYLIAVIREKIVSLIASTIAAKKNGLTIDI
jgi:hypothetical protein